MSKMSLANSALGLRQRIPRKSSSGVTQEFLQPASSSVINYRDGKLNKTSNYIYKPNINAFSSPESKPSSFIRLSVS
jgi:hypothetical protein